MSRRNGKWETVQRHRESEVEGRWQTERELGIHEERQREKMRSAISNSNTISCPWCHAQNFIMPLIPTEAFSYNGIRNIIW